MTDNYEFSKSSIEQSLDNASPYVSKQWGYVGDINSGVYANSGLTLVTFDLSSIFNSVSMVDISSSYITVPIQIVSAYTSNNSTGALVTPTSNAAPWAAHGPKSGSHQFLHAADLQVNGKTLQQYTPYLNVYSHAKLISQMSQDDLRTLGQSLNLGETLDNPQSLKFNIQANQASSAVTSYPGAAANGLALTTGLIGGNGIVNNNPFATNGTLQIAAIGLSTAAGFAAAATSFVLSAAPTGQAIAVGMFIQVPGAAETLQPSTVVTAVSVNGLTISFSPAVANANANIVDVEFFTYVGNGGDGSQGIQGLGSYNNGLFSRIKKYADATNGTVQNLYGASANTGAAASTILTSTLANNEFKPVTYISNTNYIVTNDILILRVRDIFDSLKNFPISKRIDAQLRLYINTGVVGSVVQSGGTMLHSAGTNSFTNTCPIIQSSLQNIPSGAAGIVTGVFIAKATTTNTFGVNLASCNTSNPMLQCRFVYPIVTLKPEKLRLYQSENLNKKFVYTDILFNQINAITSGATFSGILQTGVSNIRGIWIIPFVSSSINGSVVAANVASGITSFSQLQSPLDTSPATNGPLSITNLQVTIGGQNVLMNTLNFTFENFLQQVGLYEKLNAGDLGLSCGLLNQTYWENAYRVYYVDCTRGMPGDLMSPRTVLASWQNNTNVTVDYMTFVEYFVEATVNVETGIVTK